jgi:zinc protease
MGLTISGVSMVKAAPLVTDEMIKAQKSLTETYQLKNKIPVIIRRSDDSELFQILVQYNRGLKDLPKGRKALNEWMFMALPTASKTYSKESVFKLTSKYDLDLACSGGVEVSYCSLGTINDAVDEAIPMFASLIKEPLFSEEDIKLSKERMSARLKNVPSDPNQYVNDVVNTVFYPEGYPYRLNYDESLAELEQLSRADVSKGYEQLLSSAGLSIVVVTSLPSTKVLTQLEKYFADIPAKLVPSISVTAPVFDAKKSYHFVDRDVPTAFIRMKLNAPEAKSQDAYASQLFYEILSKELSEEIRTKRSLSYAVHAMTIQYTAGIGIINVSTSKPKETLEAIDQVIQTIKTRVYSQEELEEFKNIFATGYYLTQETHSSLALALSRSLYYFGDATRHYELPRKLDLVRPADITRLAKELLVNPRIGVIFNKSAFKDSWATDFIAKHQKPSPKN